jgi:uncharacterized YigZ family protein
LNYSSIAERSQFLFKEKGSKFIAIAFPCNSTESFKLNLSQIQEEFPKATHYCFAYRFYGPPISFRANDDGEPSNSAGVPILGQIQSFNLYDIAIVVVRYYGGTKLGVSGLIQAYRGASKLALENSNIIKKEPYSIYQISGDYLMISQLLAFLKKQEIKIQSQMMNEIAAIEIEVPISKKEIILSKIDNLKFKVKS